MSRAAKLADVRRVLNDGGYVRFVWVSASPTLISAGSETPIDLRSYQGFLKTVAPTLKCSRIGSTETKNLVIEWRQQ